VYRTRTASPTKLSPVRAVTYIFAVEKLRIFNMRLLLLSHDNIEQESPADAVKPARRKSITGPSGTINTNIWLWKQTADRQ